MHRRTLAALLAGTFGLACAAPAAALTCYEILDRNDIVIYRGSIAPVDLSDKGAAEREALRTRGQHLIAMEVDRCLGVEYFTGAAGTSTLTVDEIVGGIQLRGRSPGGYVAPSPAGVTPAGAGSYSAPAAPASRPSGVRSGGSRSSY
ncbi:MAG: hypothetical protein ABIR52_07110 [Casimicrobiaceae bacterium]